MNYADRGGNIGWIAAGLAPVRAKGHTGLFPVPGDTGEFEWQGFLPIEQHPQAFNPASHYIATANHNITPPGYAGQLSYEWASPERFHRIEEMLKGQAKFSVDDFVKMQQDVASLPALRFQKILASWTPGAHQDVVALVKSWDGRMTADSRAALIFEYWMARLPRALWGEAWGTRPVAPDVILDAVAAKPDVLAAALQAALGDIGTAQTWGDVHRLSLQHPLNGKKFDLESIARPGSAYTVNAASGPNHRQTNGPSYRQIIDVSNWDNSVMTNVPGESGDPASKHYGDLLGDWAAGRYHPMPFTRAAVEAATEERIVLEPGKVLKP